MIKFDEEKKGYDKAQVDGYIKTLNDEYLKLTDEYQKLMAEVEEEKNDTSHKEAIASAFIKAEISGKQIIADAEVEAKRMVYEANQEIGQINRAKQTVLEEIKNLSSKLRSILSEEVEK